MLFTILVALLVVVLIWWYRGPYQLQKKLCKLPGPSPIWPIFGNSFIFIGLNSKDSFRKLLDYMEKYKATSNMLKMFVGPMPVVFIYRAKAAEVMWKSTVNISKGFQYSFMHPWLRTGLLTSTGSKWQYRRKLLTPTFHFKILIDFLDVVNEQAQYLVNTVLADQCDKGVFDIFPKITMCALDIICETAMGKSINAQQSNGISEYIKAIFAISELVRYRVKRPWLWNDFIFGITKAGKQHNSCIKILHGFTQKVISERKEELLSPQPPAEGGSEVVTKRRLAFLDLLIHMGKEEGFSDTDIQEEVDTFMFEGHDTTAAGMTWAIQLIGSHPEVQKKLHDEMDEVFGDSDRPCTKDDMAQMKYMECVIKESLRLCPPVPAIVRSIEEDVEIDGITIPKGAAVNLFVLKINRDPDQFDNPDKFDPERFRPEISKTRYAFAYVPFSAGARNCIGQRFALNEEKCVLSSIFRKYRIEATQSMDECGAVPDLILRPSNGVKVKITRR